MVIGVEPLKDSDIHTKDSTCACGCSVVFENGSMILVHQQFDKSIKTMWKTEIYGEEE